MTDPRINDDVLIVGGGLAGLFCALKLAPRPVTLVTAAPIGEGAASAWAQGGIAAAIGEGDTPDAHAADTIAAGAGLVDEAAALSMAREAGARVADLLEIGVPFDRDIEGRLAASREAAHGARRILGVRGDLAGRAIMNALVAKVRATPSIRLKEGYRIEELARRDGRIAGATVRGADDGHMLAMGAHAVVLATGGVGALYAATTNPAEARGEGLAAAARAGALLADLEFVQFHPTAMDIGLDPAPLATEALRGEGARLVDRNGVRFMTQVHADTELAPRDVVARAVFRQIALGRGAFLDCREAVGERFADAFPKVYATCRAAGIDPAREPIPVAPAAHYHMGGVMTDARGRTSVDGLWACGEVASTGTHGANRLASNSLLEAVVYAARIADDVRALHPAPTPMPPADAGAGGDGPDLFDDEAAVARLRRTMSEGVGVVRDEAGLLAALAEIDAAERAGSARPGFRNMAAAARAVATAALRRTESRGAHFRSDHPEPDPLQRHRSITTMSQTDAHARASLDARHAARARPA